MCKFNSTKGQNAKCGKKGSAAEERVVDHKEIGSRARHILIVYALYMLHMMEK